MTKRNLTLGSASGKLGSVVYMRRRGQQIARLLVPSPRNPRTLKQRAIRAQFSNYVAAWRMLKPYIGETWRGVSRYGSTENAFAHHNRGFMPCVPAEWARVGFGVPPLGLITYGSLPLLLPYTWEYGQSVQSSDTWPGVYLRNSSGPGAPTTTGDLFAALRRWGVYVQANDVMHIVMYSFFDDLSRFPDSWGAAPNPTIVRNSIPLSADSAIALTTQVPDFLFSTGLLDGNQRRILIRPANKYENQSVYPNLLYYAIAIYFERPSNPQYSRFSRAVFAFNDRLRSYADNTSGNGIWVDDVADTYL